MNECYCLGRMEEEDIMAAPAAVRDTVVITVNGKGVRPCALAQGKRPGGRVVKSDEKWAVLSAYLRKENVPLLHES